MTILNCFYTFTKAEGFISRQPDKVLCFLGMTTSAFFFIQEQKFKLKFNRLHEYNYMTEMHDSRSFYSLNSENRLY